MKKISVVFLIITLCGIFGCKESKTITSSLSDSQNHCLKNNQACLEDVFKAYRIARSKNNISHTIDSIMMSISRGIEPDTIFMLESCNPQLYKYYAIIWNKDNIYTLSGSGSIEKEVSNEDNLELMKIIERWDENEILSKSHEKPLIYYGEWMESRIASRIVMRHAKCETVESILFSAIDMRNNAIPILFD